MIRTPHRLRVTRRVNLTPGLAFAVVDGDWGWFSGEVVPSVEPPEAITSESPREQEPYLVRWAAGHIGPGARAPVRPAERVSTATRTYEALGLPRELRSGRRCIGWELAALPLKTLYPFTVTLQEQGGEEVATDVLMAIWDDNTDRSDQGQYSTFEAEAPVDRTDLLVKNRQIIWNEIPFRIVDPYVHFTEPRIRMRLRGPR